MLLSKVGGSNDISSVFKNEGKHTNIPHGHHSDIISLKRQIGELNCNLTDEIAKLKESFEECKHPLNQQIKRLWFENISYERELKRYRKNLREFIDVNNISEDKILQINTNHGSSYFVPDKTLMEGAGFQERRSSMPPEFQRESNMKKVDLTSKENDQLLFRIQDLKYANLLCH